MGRIELPDGRVREIRPTEGGFENVLVGTDGRERVEGRWRFDAWGNVVEASAGNGSERYTFSYDRPWNPRETRVIDAYGKTTVYRLTRDRSTNRATTVEVSGTCPSCGTGPQAKYRFDDSVNPLLPTSIVDGKGVTTVLAYDARGQVRSIVEALGTPLERTTTMERTGPFPALVTRIESESSAGVPGAIREWSALYDPEGNPTEIVLSGIEAGQAFTEQARASFSATGLPTSIDPPGHASDDVTTWTYDPTRGNLLPLTRTDPLVGTTSYGYDAFNRLVSVIDPNGVETTLAYDVVHRPTEIRRKGASAGDDLVTTVEYDSLGDLLRVHQPEGNVVEYGYDGAGRVDTIERKPDATTPGERISIGYDAAGQPTSVLAQRYLDGGWQTDASTVYLRSSRCQLDGVRHADGRTTEFAYDCSQNLERVWDANHPRADFPNQPTATYGYDALHRLISASEPWAGGGSATTSFAYDLRDHLIRVVDAEGHTTSYTWSDRDLLTEEVSEYSGATTHRYDEAGDRIETLDARSVPRRFVHDALGRTTEVDLPGTSEDTHFLYDLAGVPFARGRLGSVRRGSTAVDYRFDRFGRLTREGALAYDYDRNARRTEISYPNGVRAEYGFDFANRPRSLTLREPGRGATAIVANAEYRAGGPLERLVFGNGVVESRGFDLRALPTAIGAERGGATLLDWSYTTDGLGNVLSIVDRVDASKSRLYGYQEFAYFLNRADGPWGTRAWEYSRIGDRLAETRGTERTLFRETVVEIGGQDRRQRSIEPAAGAKTQFWFDAAGNQTHEVTGNRKLLYDYGNDNRLARIVLEDPSEVGSRASFAYDGRGYLASAQLELPSGRGWSEPTEARRLVATYGGATLFHRETHAYPTVLSIRPVTTTDRDDYLLYFAGRPVGIVTHETITPWRGTPTSSRRLLYLTTDHLGTPVLATSESGAAVWSGGFEPFGADFAGASAAGVFLRFPGQWVDDTFAGSGLTYNLNRWYDNRSGRYTQADPIGLRSGPNLYGYVAANPVNILDVHGLQPERYHGKMREYVDDPGLAEREAEAAKMALLALPVVAGAAALPEAAYVGYSACIRNPIGCAAVIEAGAATMLNVDGPSAVSLPATLEKGAVCTARGVTRLGTLRRNTTDWRNLRDLWDELGYGEILSDVNRKAIARGRTPTVDDAWINFFPEDAGLRGELIPMHHIEGLPLTIPLPATRHLDAHMPGGFRYNPGGPGSAAPSYPDEP